MEKMQLEVDMTMEDWERGVGEKFGIRARQWRLEEVSSDSEPVTGNNMLTE